MLRFLCEAGGVNFQDAHGVGDERRYATLGGLALLTGVIAGLSCGVTATTQLHLPWYVASGMGLLVGLMVWGIDRMFVLTPMLKDGFLYRLGMLLTRGMISLVLGLFISHGLVMYAFNDDLEARVATAAVAAAETAEANVRKNDKNQEQIAQRKRENAKLQAEINKQQKTSDAKKKLWRDNTACIGTTRRAADGDYCGDGGVSPGLKKDWQDYRDGTLATTTSNNTQQIEKNNAEAENLHQALETKVATARKAAMQNVGVAAKTNALIELLRQDPFLLFLPLLFIVLDLAVVLSKALFPRSNIDIRAQMERENFTTMRESMASSEIFVAARTELATIEATRLLREARSREQRAAARDEKSTARYLERLNRSPSRVSRRLAWIAGGTALIVLIVGILSWTRDNPIAGANAEPSPASVFPTPTPSGDGNVRTAEAANIDRSIDLGDGVTLELPEGAISDNAKVTATPEPAGTRPGRDGYAPLTPSYKIDTAGEIVGKGKTAPHLVLTVPERFRAYAEAGSLSVAFHTEEGWKPVTGTFTASTGTYSVAMPHFSWWEFWTWDWASWGAEASQAVLSKIGMRSNNTPECTSGKKTPEWFAQAAGVVNDAGVVIRSCVQGDAGNSDVLDVQIVNNRPVGMVLNYNLAKVEWEWHQNPSTLPEAIQYALGDAAADEAGGLYLPPLGRASVGIRNTGPGAGHGFFIGPSFATLGGDVLQVLADGAFGKAVDKGTTKVAYRILRDKFKAGMAGDCGKLTAGVTGDLLNTDGAAEQDDWLAVVNRMIGGDLAECVKAVSIAAAREQIASGKDFSEVLGKYTNVVQYAQKAAKAGQLFTVAKVMATVGDIWVDSFFALGEQGYGFTVFARSTTTPSDPTPTSGPTSRSPSRTPSTEPPADPPPTDESNSPEPSASSSQPAPTPVKTETASEEVLLYDNYGTVTTAGTPMCAGNPNRPESAPGGTLTQTFTSPTSATITGATVQIDEAAAITITASILVNGAQAGTATSVPVGDTTFAFSGIAVQAGDTVGLQLAWSASATSASNPKLDTVYTVGNPGGTLTVMNSCPDGAPTFTKSSTGLRARVEATT